MKPENNIETTAGSDCPAASCSAGPTHCDICEEWPARLTERGKRCHMCETREWCYEHPVQLPSNLETVKVRIIPSPARLHALDRGTIHSA